MTKRVNLPTMDESDHIHPVRILYEYGSPLFFQQFLIKGYAGCFSEKQIITLFSYCFNALMDHVNQVNIRVMTKKAIMMESSMA